VKDSDHTSGLGAVVQNMLGKHPVFQANPIGDWADIAGIQVARYSSPKTLKDGRLTVVCHDSIWKHHLEMMRDQLLARINQAQSAPLVKRIVFKIGELPEADEPLNPNHRMLEKLAPKRLRRSRPKVSKRPLTADEEELVKKLPDKELRTLARRILSRIPIEE
jgi:hypothetical protein